MDSICDNCNYYLDEDYISDSGLFFCSRKCKNEYWLLAFHDKG